MSIKQITIGVDGAKVLITINGKTESIPWEAADEIANALITKARQAEEEDKKQLIARDNAILLRCGVPIGLSNRKDIVQETEFLAQYDDKLVKYIPSIKSTETFGTPSVVGGKLWNRPK